MKLTIIGGGNMGSAIAFGLIEKGLIKASDIVITDASTERLGQLRDIQPGVNYSTENVEAVKGADVVLFAVKPWLLEEVAAGVRDVMDYSKQYVISIVAGITTESLENIFSNGKGVRPAVFRLIPNTAISLGKSVTFITGANASQAQTDEVMSLFGALGLTMLVKEDMMAAGTSLASCGIAFALRYLDASMQGGEKLGFGHKEAREIVIKTMEGALALLNANGSDPQPEIDKVTTKGGITIKGLEAMKREGFEHSVLCGLEESR